MMMAVVCDELGLKGLSIKKNMIAKGSPVGALQSHTHARLSLYVAVHVICKHGGSSRHHGTVVPRLRVAAPIHLTRIFRPCSCFIDPSLSVYFLMCERSVASKADRTAESADDCVHQEPHECPYYYGRIVVSG